MSRAENSAKSAPATVAWGLIAAGPAAMAWATWHLAGPTPPDIVFARFAAPPLLGIEAAVIGLALLRGFRPRETARCLPGWVRASLVLVLLIASWTALRVPDVTMAVLRFGTTAIHLGFGLALGFLANREGVPRVGWPAVAIGGLVYLLVVVTFVQAIPNPALHDWARFGLGVVNVRHAGFYAAVAAASAIAGAILTSHWPTRVGWTLVAALLTTFLAWIGSRGGFVALGVGALATTIVLGVRRHAILPGLALFVLVAGALASLPMPVPGPQYGILRMAETMTGEVPDRSSGRYALWRGTVGEIGHRPLFGHGEGAFFGTLPLTDPVHHPHNAALQLLFQWGFAGFALSVAIGLGLWFRMRRAVLVDPTLLPGFLVANTLLVYALYDGILFFVYPAMMLVAACASTAGAGVATAGRDRYLGRR